MDLGKVEDKIDRWSRRQQQGVPLPQRVHPGHAPNLRHHDGVQQPPRYRDQRAQKGERDRPSSSPSLHLVLHVILYYNTVLYDTILYYTILHYTILVLFIVIGGSSGVQKPPEALTVIYQVYSYIYPVFVMYFSASFS